MCMRSVGARHTAEIYRASLSEPEPGNLVPAPCRERKQPSTVARLERNFHPEMLMARKQQRRKVGKVMHEYKEGQLRSGRSGRKVKSRRQAIAIAMSESGQSRR